MKTSSFITHFAAAIIITGIMLTIYATVQQVHRSAANDPQLQLARDLSEFLQQGKPIDKLLPAYTIDLAKSPGVFVAMYDAKGNPLSSTGLIDGKLPRLPQGFFDFAKANKEHSITWQPRQDIRQALVIESVASPAIAYVAVGRSLQEVEVRESNLVTMVFIAWVACMMVLVIHFIFQWWIAKRNSN